jgi:hypothetical protein
MIVSREGMRAFGISDDVYDDFMEGIQDLKDAGSHETLTTQWICGCLRICPHILFAMVDAGIFPAPIADDDCSHERTHHEI